MAQACACSQARRPTPAARVRYTSVHASRFVVRLYLLERGGHLRDRLLAPSRLAHCFKAARPRRRAGHSSEVCTKRTSGRSIISPRLAWRREAAALMCRPILLQLAAAAAAKCILRAGAFELAECLPRAGPRRTRECAPTGCCCSWWWSSI